MGKVIFFTTRYWETLGVHLANLQYGYGESFLELKKSSEIEPELEIKFPPSGSCPLRKKYSKHLYELKLDKKSENLATQIICLSVQVKDGKLNTETSHTTVEIFVLKIFQHFIFNFFGCFVRR